MVCVCWQQQEWGKTLSSHRASVHLCVLSHVQLYVTLWTVALQALLSMGFSGQEYWSGFQFLLPGDLPYPWIGPTSPASPAPQGESLMLSHQGSPISSFCAVAGLVSQSCPILCVPMDCSPPGSSVHGPSPGKNTGVGASSRGSSQARDETQVSCIAGRFFTIWATREACGYWSGSLSLLQGIFLTQESNWGLLHCRDSLAVLPGKPIFS